MRSRIGRKGSAHSATQYRASRLDSGLVDWTKCRCQFDQHARQSLADSCCVRHRVGNFHRDPQDCAGSSNSTNYRVKPDRFTDRTRPFSGALCAASTNCVVSIPVHERFHGANPAEGRSICGEQIGLPTASPSAMGRSCLSASLRCQASARVQSDRPAWGNLRTSRRPSRHQRPAAGRVAPTAPNELAKPGRIW